MMTNSSPKYRFGDFELDPLSGELRKNGHRLKIQEQSLQILELLLANPGMPVTREELRIRLWPAGTFVDFEHGINAAVKRLREVLSDEADNPKFIETLPRRGYRFIAPIDCETQAQARPKAAPIKTALLVLVAGLLATTTAFYFSRRGEWKLPAMRVVPFTSLPDRAEGAVFSPDGNQVAFARYSDLPAVSGIYTKQIGSDRLLQLTQLVSNERNYFCCPVWSPDGRYIAFSRYIDGKHAIFVVSSLGGAERQLWSGATGAPWLDWSPDGKFIAFSARDSDQHTYSIFLLSTEELEAHKLTHPTAENQDSAPAFSPDGRQLAFVRMNGALTMADIFLVPLSGGEARRLTFDNAMIPSPPAWARDGKSLVFSSTRSSIPTLWRIPAFGGSPAQLPQVGVVSLHPSISPKGQRLAYDQIMGSSSIWSLDLGNKKNHPTQVTLSKGYNRAPALSPDGAKIAFQSDRSGSLEIWVCNRDGSNLNRLTSVGSIQAGGGVLQWSPNSQRIAFDSPFGGHNTIFVLQADSGFPRPLVRANSDSVNPTWSRDGSWIYFASNRTGQWQIWKIPSGGGAPLQVTKNGGFLAFEASDGKSIYYAKAPSDSEIWRMRFEDGQEAPLSPRIPLPQWRDWVLADKGIFFRDERSSPGPVLKFTDLATSRTRNVLTFEKPSEWFSASPDGRFILYQQADGYESNIMLLEGFR